MNPRLVAGVLVILLASSGAWGQVWMQTSWAGGDGQLAWMDPTKYYQGQDVDGWRHTGSLELDVPEDGSWEAATALAGAVGVNDLLVDGQTIYAAAEVSGGYGVVFKTTDRGLTWDTTATLPGGISALCLMGGGGDMFVGCGSYDRLAVSTDGGTSWDTTEVLTGVTAVYALLRASDNSLYAACTDGMFGLVFRSTDDGISWEVADTFSTATSAFSLMESGAGQIYAGTGENGDIFRTTDAGVTWFNTGDIPGVAGVECLFEGLDGNQYAGTRPNSRVYRSTDSGGLWIGVSQFSSVGSVTDAMISDQGYVYAVGIFSAPMVVKTSDNGTTWDTTAGIVGVTNMPSIVQDTEGLLYVAADAGVQRAGYFPSGYMVSSVFDADSDSFGVINWDDSLGGQLVIVKVRSDMQPDMSTAMGWGACPAATNGQDITGLASVTDGDRYVQYRTEFGTGDRRVSPVLDRMRIMYFIYIRDMGASALVNPESVVLPEVPLFPRGWFMNYGDVDDSFWVYCEIDSLFGASQTTIYRDSVGVNSLAPGDSVLAQFGLWISGSHGSRYEACIFSDLQGDQIRDNDTLCTSTTAFREATKITSKYTQVPPAIDGSIDSLEWSEASAVDVTNIRGWLMGQGPLAFSGVVRVLNDSQNVYVAVDAAADTFLAAGDSLGVFIDEDRDGFWASDSSEGVFYCERVSPVADTLTFQPMLTGAPTGVSGGQVATGAPLGHVSYEVLIPFGAQRWELDAAAGDTVGVFIQIVDQLTGEPFGWWPQSVPDTLWDVPTEYGRLILDYLPVGVTESRVRPGSSSGLMLKALPNPFDRSVSLVMTIGRRESVEQIGLCAYDVSGRLVKRFEVPDAGAGSGAHLLHWDGNDEAGRTLPTGMYFLKLSVGSLEHTEKVILLR